ncbi:MAG: ABC transporter substrate-binding protein [Proteobacteria bacterium]|nr:ABC transporter substrate-binding protein [Pseudomonadota bacterium]
MLSRRSLFALTAGAGLAGAGATIPGRRARAASQTLKIGVITDMTGPLSSVLGMGSVEGARMAVEDFGGSAAGMPVEIVYADHQSKADIALSIARKWIDEDGVDMLLDIGNSAAAIAVEGLLKEKNRIGIITGAASSDITGKFCNNNTFHWGYDTYMQSAAPAGALTRQGADTWFFITIDYAFGHSLEADATARIIKDGGKVLGSVRHPANSTDFSSYLLQAQSSGAKAIGVANAGSDMEHCLKQGAEFGIWQKQKAAVFGMQMYNVPAIGQQTMQGIIHNSVFLWDRTPETIAFSDRFRPRNGGKPPAETHAVNYSGALQYLKAVKAVGGKDPAAVSKALHEMPVEDFVSVKGSVRKDGRLIRPTFLLRVKKPDQVKAVWDCLEVIDTIPGDQAFRPASESACPLMKAS